MTQTLTLFTVIAIGLLALFAFRTGLARLLRIIGNAFIAAGDSVDHWRERFRALRSEQVAHEDYLEQRRVAL